MGGHGALIENLGALDADIVFIKNVDNVVPDRTKPVGFLWKKLLAGRTPDITLHQGDFVIVKESFF